MKNRDTIEYLLREHHVDPKSEKLMRKGVSKDMKNVFKNMKYRQMGIKQTLKELASAVSFEVLVGHILTYLPDTKYFYIGTNDSKTIKMKLLDFIEELYNRK